MVDRVEFTTDARGQLLAAELWISEYSPPRAERWKRGLLAEIETLKTFPNRSPIAPESESAGEVVREFRFGNRREVYRILYVVREESLLVVDLRHGVRGPVDP